MKNKLLLKIVALIIASIVMSCVTSQQQHGGISKKEKKTLIKIEEKISQGDTQSAIEEFEKIKENSPENQIAYSGLLISAAKYDEAEIELNRLLENDPDNDDALFYLALIKGIKNEPKKEIELLERVIKINPSHSDALSVRASFYLGSNIEKAVEFYQKSLETNPDNIQSLSGLGTSLVRQDKLEEAEPYLNKAVELDPSNPYTHLDRSKVRTSLGDYRGAEEDLTAAIEMQPDYFWHYLDRGRLRFRSLKDYEGAIDDLTMALKLDPENFYPLVYRAASYDMIGDIKSAAEDYRSIIRMKPNYHEAYSSLGIDSFMLENWDECIESFEKAFTYESSEYSYLAMAALSEYKKDHLFESRKYFQEIMDQIPSGNIYRHIIRSFLDDTYESYTINLINQEKDSNRRNRLFFYMAELYKERGFENTAIDYFKEVANIEEMGYFEGRIAKYELEKK